MFFFIEALLITVLVITSTYLIRRAFRIKSITILFLAIAYISFLIPVLLEALLPPEDILVESIAALNFPIFIILFTKFAFYEKQKSKFKYIITIAIILRGIHFTEINIFGFVSPPLVPVPPDRLWAYYFHVSLVAIQISIALAWLAFAAIKAYNDSRNEKVEIWVKKRYLFVGISNLLYAVISFSYFFFPTDGLAYASPNALVADAVVVPLHLVYVILNMFAWLMPNWFKRYLNGGHALIEFDKDAEMLRDLSPSISEQVLTTPELMKAIDYLGAKLAKLINQSPDAAKGLFLVAIEKEFGEFGLHVLKIDNLLRVVNNSLKQMLLDLHVEEPDKIVVSLSDEIFKNQSLFLMIAL